MYVIDNKVFYHMVKSAGISIHNAAIYQNRRIDFNARHLQYELLPERFKELPKYIIYREPQKWYRSFYSFFINVEGFFSFLIHDPDENKILHPIGLNEFIKRSSNLKETLIKFPNKARVFNNILRSQGDMHFINTYFKSSFDLERLETLEQFDKSLFEWFWENAGGYDADYIIHMDELNKIEEIFNIELNHLNKTKKTIEEEFTIDNLNYLKNFDSVLISKIKNRLV